MKTVRRKIVLISGLVPLVLCVSNIVLVEVRVRSALSRVHVGMTEEDVIRAMSS